MSRIVEIPHGKRYIIERCTYCGRRLAEWYEGEPSVTILHGKAGVTYGATHLPPEGRNGRTPGFNEAVPMYPVEGTAKCYRITCRIRRRLDRANS